MPELPDITVYLEALEKRILDTRREGKGSSRRVAREEESLKHRVAVATGYDNVWQPAA